MALTTARCASSVSLVLELVCRTWRPPLHQALHLLCCAQPPFSSASGTNIWNIRIVISHITLKGKVGANYKRRLTYIGMQVGNIGARTCCLMELHFQPVLFVLFRGLVQTHALIRSASKYSLKKIEKLEHTLFLGSDQWATSAIHSSS